MRSKPLFRFLYTTILISLLFAGSFLPATAQGEVADPSLEPQYKAGEILVKFEPGRSVLTNNSIMAGYSANYLDTIYGDTTQVWQVPEGEELQITTALNQEPGVVFAQPNYRYSIFLTVPNDGDYSNQWAHTNIESARAWDLLTGGENITIAIIDSGVDLNHPDLVDKLVQGKDFVDGDNNPKDLNGHGTHVAGIAAASTNNNKGIAGVSWGAKIMPVRVMDANGSGWDSDIIAGINWAYQNGANIINLSLGGPSSAPAMQSAINAAHAAGTLVIAAMGNDRVDDNGEDWNPISYPAAYNNVMAVSAVNRYDDYSFFSQYGPHCDIAAPGGEMSNYHDPGGIYSTMPTYDVYLTTHYSYSNNYDYLHGTSQATPYVAGLAALIWSANPGMTPDDVQNVIQDTADDIGAPGWDVDYGHGRINAWQAALTIAVPESPVLNAIENADGNGSYQLNWNSVDLATSYKLQEDDNEDFSSPVNIYMGEDSQYSVTGRLPGIWYYRVSAIGDSGNSGWSNVVFANVMLLAPIMDPISNTAQIDAYTITWTTSVGADGYILQQSPDMTFTLPVTRYMGTDTQYQVTGQDGGDWYYRVSAYNQVGSSPWSTPIYSTTVMTPALQAPLLMPISNTMQAGTYTVTWTDVPSATGYILEESFNPYFSAPEMVYSGTLTQTQILQQPAGDWYYRVRALGMLGNSPWSNAEDTTVMAYVYLPMITNGNPFGFYSQFNDSADGWSEHTGNWTLANGNFTTVGVSGSSASVSYFETFDDFDYRVKMLREGCNVCANRVIVRGDPSQIDKSNHWLDQYYFQYLNEYEGVGYYSVVVADNGLHTILQDWTTSTAIKSGDWNTLRVVAVGNSFDFYINDQLVWSGKDNSFASGQVGFGMYRNDTSTGDRIKVDWAELTEPPEEALSAELGLPSTPVEILYHGLDELIP